MDSKAERKEAARKFKELKPRRGVYAVRCTATARTWVGSTLNLDSTKNRFWLGLRMGGHPDKSIQLEWNTHGEAAFEYEILEVLDEDLPALLLGDAMKERRRHWIERLGAHATQ